MPQKWTVTRRTSLRILGSLAIAPVASLCAGVAGCSRGQRETLEVPHLTVATPWSRGERNELEATFARFLQDQGRNGTIRWISVAPGDELERLLRVQPGVDALLGASWDWVARVREGHGRAFADTIGVHPQGSVVARSLRLGWIVAEDQRIPTLSPNRFFELWDAPQMRGHLAWDDPRYDPLSRAVMIHWLSSGPWAAQYAALVRAAANAPAIGSISGGAHKRVYARQALAAPMMIHNMLPDPMLPFVPLPDPQGAAAHDELGVILRPAQNHPLASAFLDAVALHRREREGEPPPPAAPTPLPLPLPLPGDGNVAANTTTTANESSQALDLTTDLLSATLIDNHGILYEAWGAVIAAGRPKALEDQLTQAPPWPPASVQAIRRKHGIDADVWLRTLVEQLIPDDDRVSTWLLSSWDATDRYGNAEPLDGARLETLAQAMGGRLARQPRFRAWLRTEWSAWARQNAQEALNPAKSQPSETAAKAPALTTANGGRRP